jgi:hypothetical protein
MLCLVDAAWTPHMAADNDQNPAGPHAVAKSSGYNSERGRVTPRAVDPSPSLADAYSDAAELRERIAIWVYEGGAGGEGL